VQAFAAIWDKSDRPVLDRLADTFVLGDARARALLTQARDVNAPAPTALPEILSDAKQPAFFRVNLTLAYAKALSNRRIYEEALDAFRAARPEQVVDPASYLFHRAVAEYSLLRKKDAQDTIFRLLDDVPDAPDRYKTVAALMQLDMLSWRDKDLAEIARKMDNIQRRLELARGGKKTQEQEKEVIARLDEIIKKLENMQKGQAGSMGNGGACPNGGMPNSNIQASSPQQDSYGGNGTGPGRVDGKLKNLTENWGKLPEKERVKAMAELTRGMPPQYKELIEDYFRKIAQAEIKEDEKSR
jgi:tetratricopeptide (TPR) repeat protein